MSPRLVLGFLVAALCATAHSLPGSMLDQETVTPEDQLNRTPVDNLRLASSNTDFAFSLYKQLASRNPSKNVIFSPLSISTALAFLSLGARGATLTEILEGLKFNLTETPETEIHQGFQNILRSLSQPSSLLQLSMGNAMFVSKQLELLDKFRDDAKELYASEAFATNFQDPTAAKKLINDYVKEKTQGNIADLVTDLDPNTAMILVNYIFFKAKWKTPFDPDDTFESRFYLSKKKVVKVPMMSIEDLTIPYFRDEELSCTVVELKYVSNDSALFILPDMGKMKALEAMLLPETLKRWRDSLQMRLIDELYLPKFSISSNYNLENILPQLGMSQVFTKQADLSGVTGAKNLEVTQVVHKALMKVAETGTEAAAATGIKMIPMSGKVGPMTIVNFNRPFLLSIISKNTQSIMFFVKVVNPKQA